MGERTLNLNQQIALLPAAIHDSILDFLEEFNYPAGLTTEVARAAYDPDYLKTNELAIKEELDRLRAEMGKLIKIQVDAGGREIPGGYLLKLGFERGVKGLGLLTKLKERTIFQVVFQRGDFEETSLRDLMKNPPK